MDQHLLRGRLPLVMAALAGILLVLGGVYFFADRNAAERGDPAGYAAADAARAAAAAGIDPKQRAATEAIVRAYILEHPEIITEAVTILQKREVTKRLDSAGPALTKAFPGAVGGNPDGAVTLTMFTDYNCGFCRASIADVNRIVAANGDVRVVYRELPILSPTSRDAARWALAAAKQGKYKAFHDAMFAAGPANAQTIRAAAQRAGLNLAQAERDAASPEIAAEIDANLAMMQQVGFNGTPTFVVGGQMLEGALGFDALNAAIEKARKRG